MMRTAKTVVLILLTATIMNGCSNSPTGTSDNEFYTKSIERIAENQFEQELIEKAEAKYPPRDSVLAAVFPWQQESIPETKYWWYSRYDGVYLPYALTIDAVQFYENFIDSLAAKEEDDFYKTANLEYNAQVNFHDSFEIFEQGFTNPTPKQLLGSFENVYVVEMYLSFKFECFVHCRLNMRPNRIVVFDSKGELLEVFYDGVKAVAVS